MNIRGAWNLLWQRKESATGRVIALSAGPGQAVWTKRDFAAFSREAYQKNVIAYRAIRLIATASASVRLCVFRKEIELDSHPLLALIDRPNPLMAQAEFIEAVTAYYHIAGNEYVEAAGATTEKMPPRELWPLRPDRMRVLAGESNIPAAFIYAVGSNEVHWPVDQLTANSNILHLRTFNPMDDWYGLSPLEAAAMSVDIHNDALGWNKTLVQNDARPPGVLTYAPKEGPDVLTDDQRARVVEELEKRYSGKESTKRPLLLEGGLEWQQLGLSPKDMDFIEAKHTTATDIAMAFGVPPQMIGVPGSQTFANYEQARLAFWEETVIPWLYNLRDELNGWLAPRFADDVRIDCDLDEVPALAERRRAHFDMVRDADWLSVNEKREAMGLEPVEGGEAVLVPATMLPLNLSMDEPPEQDDEAAKEFGGDIEYKLFIKPSGAGRQRELAIQLRMAEALERRLVPRVFALIDNRAKAAARNIESGAGELGIDMALRGHDEEMAAEIVGHYQTVMQTFGQRVLDAGKALPEARETKDMATDFLTRITKWINEFGALKVVDITETTRRQIREALLAGEQAGEALPDIAKRILTNAGGINARVRALTIARTETHAAAVASNDMALSSIGLDNIEREWVAAEDGRTRPPMPLRTGSGASRASRSK